MKDHDPGSARDAGGHGLSRREFLQRGGLGLLSFTIAGQAVLATPAQAREAGAAFGFLTAAEAVDLELLGEAFVPGSRAAGLAHYVDHQLAGSPADCMLMAKYVGVAPPLAPFYRAALAAVHAALANGDGDPPSRARALAAALGQGAVDGWSGPPAGLVGFVLRTDAIDVVYGTPEGFAALGVPYMAHIAPPTPWGEAT